MIDEDPNMVLKVIGADIGLISAAAPDRDRFGQYSNSHCCICGSPWQENMIQFFATVFKNFPNTPVCLNTLYRSWDALYRDIKLINTI